MKILAIDSSALCASVALCDGERRLSESFINTTNTHSETLLPMVKTVLEQAKMHIEDVEALACTVGPGSFTGVRIGVALVKGLAAGRGIPCIGVSTLEATAEAARTLKGLIVPVTDARRCGLYNAVFESDGSTLTRLTPDKLDLPDELARETEVLAKEKRLNVYFVGDGYDRVRPLSKSARIKDTPELLKLVSAYSTAQTADRVYKQAKDRSVFTDENLAAVYLRPAQAERERLERLAGK
ncbi:MAG: tRNA (adenosine(37)-N6)-threonylcarbamoyltransferase complex dimerization subunit type 1 TsaB [Clostridia bacterium]|nr:tRNA (adenosine(37)-N6)-threonylcarbamoyltransferase complex dimerization subunit type 1 TsaB [Clostridia bacterium]